MPETIQIKRRNVGAPGAPPALRSGELAHNDIDDILYYGRGDDGYGEATSIVPIGGAGLIDDVETQIDAVDARVPYARAQFASMAAAVSAALSSGRPLALRPSETAIVPAVSGTDINTKLIAIREWRIPVGAKVRITVPDGVYSVNTPHHLNHQDGARIEIIGNTSDPTLCVLEFPASYANSAFYAGFGGYIGLIDGFEVRVASLTTPRPLNIAFLADNGGTINLGPNIIARRFYWNYFARCGGIIVANYSKGYEGGDANYLAYQGGFISCRNAIGNDANDAPNFLGSGLVVEAGGSADATDATFSGNWLAGCHALTSGSIRGKGVNASNNTGSGLLVNGGTIDAANSIRNDNGRYGVELNSILAGGSFYGPPPSAPTGNALGAESPRLDGFTSSGQAGFRAAGSAADIPVRLDAKGGAGFFFNANGRAQFAIGYTALAVNYAFVEGSIAGASVRFGAAGASTDVGMRFDTKGAGNFFFNANGRAQFGIGSTALAVNYVYVAGGVAGDPVTVSALGGDANVDLFLVPRGSGVVRFGAWTTNADAAVNGYITIKDAAGNLRKIPTIA